MKTKKRKFELSRRSLLKWGLAAGAATTIGTKMLRPDKVLAALPPENPAARAIENFPVSPFILGAVDPDTGIRSPFVDPLPQLTALPVGWQAPDGTLLAPDDPNAWIVRRAAFPGATPAPGGAPLTAEGLPGVRVPPGPALSQQDVYGFIAAEGTATNGQDEDTILPVEHAGTHQVWPVPLAAGEAGADANGNILAPSDSRPIGGNFDRLVNWPTLGVAPILYHLRIQPGTANFSASRVRAVGRGGRRLRPRDRAALIAAGVALDANNETTLPPSTIWGFNGGFPGALINGEYGKPTIVRFENDLDINPLALDYQNFGAPDLAFLTHQHNGHTAPESDGQPHYMTVNEGGYTPGDWIDSLYLSYPAGGDGHEIQSFLWFHDHRMHHTGANVYKGMVGLFPMYDPGMPDPANPGQLLPFTGLDTGNETDPAPNLGLPGVRTNNPDGTFNVAYDIHMALYDVALDDGLTRHLDSHTPNFPPDFPSAAVPGVAADAPGATHPEWWGKQFFKHFPNHGFVGDIFTVNGLAFPVLHVEPRRYRFRFLDASVARIYELALMTSAAGPVEKPGTQGQWQIPDGALWEPWTMIASMGGLLPQALETNTFHIWPASRREFVVDFTGLNADSPPIYLTNILLMENGRKPTFNKFKANRPIADQLAKLRYKVPLVKIVVDLPLNANGDGSTPIVGAVGTTPGTPLRPMPLLADGTAINQDNPTVAALMALAPKDREFILKRSGKLGLENSWLINKAVFVPEQALYRVIRERPEVWITTNGGGGWVHPMHMHQEEHTTLLREGSTLPDGPAGHPEDTGKEDVANLEPGESVFFYRNFRTFEGRYVAHCHNLAHEDHNMMFGWTILPADTDPNDPAVGMQVVTGGGM